jgi:Tol biopolymer transport system component
MAARLIALASIAIVAAGLQTGSTGAATPGAWNRIVFADGPTTAIWTMSSTGYDLRRLTPVGAGDETPTWSRDKRRIAFVRLGRPNWSACGEKRSALMVMNADGTNAHRVTSVRPCGVNGLTWSPDGSKLAWGGSSGVYVVDVDGHRKRLLTPAGGYKPAWSPEGKLIAYGLDEAIWVLDVATQRTRILHRPGAAPSWSPDGKTLLFIAGSKPGRPGSYWIIWDRPRGRVLPLARIPGRGGGNVWSPDGSRIAFWNSTADYARHWIVTVDRRGGDMRVLVPESRAARITGFDW